MATVLLQLISVYRYCISPMSIGCCRFYPTCSQYSQQAIIKHGAVKGTMLTIKRISHCHPFHEGGIDLVPEPSKLKLKK